MPDRYLDGLLRFGRFLRRRGLAVTPARMCDLVAAVPECDLRTPDDLFLAGRTVLVDRFEDLSIYDQAFRDFWKPSLAGGVRDVSPHALPHTGAPAAEETEAPPITRAEPGEPRSARFGKPVPSPPIDAEEGQGQGAGKLSYSPAESIHDKELQALTVEEIRRAKRLLAEMRWMVTSRRSRRRVRSRKGDHVDWRRSMRRNVRHGGVLLELAHQRSKTVRRPVIAICDVSGSMDRYTRPILHFIHTMASGFGRTESFVFGTRLTRVTRLLESRNPDQALLRVSGEVKDWSGGTRIGESIRLFNRRWSRRVLGRGAVVIVVSDGWDRGDPELLATELARLQRRCHRLVWLNPALEPLADRPVPVGMQAAAPYVDDLLPARRLEDMAELSNLMAALRPGRPARRPRKST